MKMHSRMLLPLRVRVELEGCFWAKQVLVGAVARQNQEPSNQAELDSRQCEEPRTRDWEEKPGLQANQEANWGLYGHLKSTMGMKREVTMWVDLLQVWVQSVKCGKENKSKGTKDEGCEEHKKHGGLLFFGVSAHAGWAHRLEYG